MHLNLQMRRVYFKTVYGIFLMFPIKENLDFLQEELL